MSMDDPESRPEPPIISLEEVRERRRAEADRAEQARRRGEQLFRQRRALTEAILGGRVKFMEIKDMIRLGVITDDEERLPCHDIWRQEDYFKWVRLTYDIKLDGEGEAEEEAAQGDWVPDWMREARRRPVDRHRVQCPILASSIIIEESPPCIEALRAQVEMPSLRPGEPRKEMDPEDPVVKHEVRPCLLLGGYAILGAMEPVWAQEPPKDD